MEWNVFYHNWNSRKIETYNVFHHGGFLKDVEKYLKKCESREEFAEELRRSLLYYFWSKSEWEILVGPWIGSWKDKTEKVDVYQQVMMNWDKFLDYVWKEGGRSND